MGNQITEIQDQFCSSYDKRKLCSFDIEYIDTPTKPLIHQAARYLFFTKGHGSMTVDSKSYEIRPHTFVAILPWEITEVTAVDAPLEFFKIIYNSDFINNTIKFGYNTGNNFFNIRTHPFRLLKPQCKAERCYGKNGPAKRCSNRRNGRAFGYCTTLGRDRSIFVGIFLRRLWYN